MITTPEDLFAFLQLHGVTVETHSHMATFTVEEGRALKAAMPGGHTKNLFLVDKQGAEVLVSAHADSQLPLNRLHRHIGTRRLSFAKPDKMYARLGVKPGAVTAFALVNTQANPIRFILDAALLAYDPINFHPLVNTATTAISQESFNTFLAATGHAAEIVDFQKLD